MYYLRIDGINFPVAPESITTDHTNKNQTVTLANEKEINILKKEGLKNFTFDVRLPDYEYSWAYWEQPEGVDLESGFNEPSEFVDILQTLKNDKKSFLLMIVREDGVNFEESGSFFTSFLKIYALKAPVRSGAFFACLFIIGRHFFRSIHTKFTLLVKEKRWNY